ncbi:MAG: Hpt domain-containing protein [Hyphomicrobiaceae bacterium]
MSRPDATHTLAQPNAAASQPIDHAYLSRYTMGNSELEAEVLDLFVDQAPEYMMQMRNAATDKAWRDAAHTLKGSARAVGALEVAKCAEEAEAAGRNA